MFTFGVLLLDVVFTFGALPPLSSTARSSTSAQIFTGVVETVSSSLVERHDQTDESAEWADHEVAATLRVDAVEKDTTAACIAGKLTTVLYRRTARRPQGWVGPQGQNDDMVTNSRVRCFVDANGWLLSPNGWELLDKPDAQPLTRTPRLRHSRRHDFSGTVTLNRNVTTAECPWLSHDIPCGHKLRIFNGYTYGTISLSGVAVQEVDQPEDSPFFEVPAEALLSEATKSGVL